MASGNIDLIQPYIFVPKTDSEEEKKDQIIQAGPVLWNPEKTL